jgi:hypothetical protein
LRVAFFGLLFGQPLDVPVQVFARDEAGNQAMTPLDHMVFSKAYQKSRIEVDDRFLQIRRLQGVGPKTVPPARRR